MNIIKQPFFFNDEEFISDITIWKELIKRSTDAGKQVPLQSAANETKTLNKEESEKVIAFYSVSLNAYGVFIRMTTRIMNQINNDNKLMTEYNQNTIPVINVVGAQIFQYIFTDKTIEQLLPMVQMESDKFKIITEWVKNNDDDAGSSSKDI